MWPNQYGASSGGSGNGSGGYGTGAEFGGYLGGGLGDLFGAYNIGRPQYNNPFNAANPYLQQMGQQGQQMYNPYINAGQGALPSLQNQYGQLVNNPGGVLSSMGAGYHQSPGYQWQLGQGMQAVGNAAAAGGMAGSPQQQQQAATMATGLANQDYYNYLNNVQHLYSQGLAGQQGLYDTGFNATNQLNQDYQNQYASQAQGAFAGAAGQNQFNQNKSQGVAGAFGSALNDLGTAAGLKGWF